MYRPKPWYAKLNRPNLDYSSLFPDKPGRLPGLSLWQIENFVPVMVDEGLSVCLSVCLSVSFNGCVYVHACMFVWVWAHVHACNCQVLSINVTILTASVAIFCSALW